MRRPGSTRIGHRFPDHAPGAIGKENAMLANQRSSFSHVYGNEAVLSRLERLGRSARIFPHLVQVGFPAPQLEVASRWFAETAGSPVDRYASRKMAKGIFEDESLLTLFCRYFECTDWKLENSPWFFSHEDYDRFFGALLEPLETALRQLEQGQGGDRWRAFFEKMPFDLAMERVKQALWSEVAQQEFYWKPQASYTHLRAEMLFAYMTRSVNILNIDPAAYNYDWERRFRERLHHTLRAIEKQLAAAAPAWLEPKHERTRRRRNRRGPGAKVLVFGPRDVLRAFSALNLEAGRATARQVRGAFRRLSKAAHPDSGGSPEAFRELTRCKELAEAWLARKGEK